MFNKDKDTITYTYNECRTFRTTDVSDQDISDQDVSDNGRFGLGRFGKRTFRPNMKKKMSLGDNGCFFNERIIIIIFFPLF